MTAQALVSAPRPQMRPPPIEIIGGFYRAAVVAFAAELGVDARRALTVRSASNFDPQNRLAGRARRLAFYLTCCAYDVPRAVVAAAAGYSKQAASAALHAVEDAREADPSLDALLRRVGALLTGRDLT